MYHGTLTDSFPLHQPYTILKLNTTEFGGYTVRVQLLVPYISLNITNKMQRYTIFFITVNSLHVSGGFSVHHQELKNCTHSIRYMSSKQQAAVAAPADGRRNHLKHVEQ